MTHPTATREEWLRQRLELLEAEKALTRKSDELTRQRLALPWVKVDKDYRFDTCQGEKSLAELFHGRSQLLVYHLMFGPDYTAPCASCSMIADGFNGFWEHLAHHDVMLVAVSRAPFDEDRRRISRRPAGRFPGPPRSAATSTRIIFVGFSEAQQDQGYDYNFQDKPPLPAEMPAEPDSHAGDVRGRLAHLPQGNAGDERLRARGRRDLHTYSTYGRGLDSLWGAYQWLDRAPLGRNEPGGPWWKRRYEYGAL